MTIMNRDLFYRDPTNSKIPNDGIAQVVRPQTEQQWDVLEWELKSFVCEREYARGLERILSSFLTNLSQSQQPAVWVKWVLRQRQVAPRPGAGVPVAGHATTEWRKRAEPRHAAG